MPSDSTGRAPAASDRKCQIVLAATSNRDAVFAYRWDRYHGPSRRLNAHYVHLADKFLTAVLSYAAMLDSAVIGNFACFDAKIESPALRAVAGHWDQARRQRRMPSWSDLNPATLAPHFGLIWAFRYDRGTGEFTARLAGNRIMVACGKSFRGTPLRELHPPEIFLRARAGLTRVVQEPACCRSSGPLFRADGKTTNGERIVLPLGTDGEADGALGASDYNRSFMTAARDIESIYNAVEWFSL